MLAERYLGDCVILIPVKTKRKIRTSHPSIMPEDTKKGNKESRCVVAVCTLVLLILLTAILAHGVCYLVPTGRRRVQGELTAAII